MAHPARGARERTWLVTGDRKEIDTSLARTAGCRPVARRQMPPVRGPGERRGDGSIIQPPVVATERGHEVDEAPERTMYVGRCGPGKRTDVRELPPIWRPTWRRVRLRVAR